MKRNLNEIDTSRWKKLAGIIKEDTLGKTEPIGLSKLPDDLAKASAGGGLKDKNPGDDKVSTGKFTKPAKDLNPSQQQIVLIKAFNMALDTKAMGGKWPAGGDIGAISSNDDRIMDGHHRWASTLLADPDAGISGKLINLPSKDLITALNVYTKGIIGKKSGNPGKGSISQFTGDNIQKTIIDVAEKTGKSPDHPDVKGYELEEMKRRIGKLAGGDYEKGLEIIKARADWISNNKKVEGWMPDRPDMPVIQKSQLDDVATAFEAGEIDIKEPFSPDVEKEMGGEEVEEKETEEVTENIIGSSKYKEFYK